MDVLTFLYKLLFVIIVAFTYLILLNCLYKSDLPTLCTYFSFASDHQD